MEKVVDARGLACPESVIRAKETLEGEQELVVLVDNDTAAENIRRLGIKSGCTVLVNQEADGCYRIRLIRTGEAPAPGSGTDVEAVCKTAGKKEKL